MATKKERIREADQIVDQNVAPVSAQPATLEEVAQAPVEVPVDQVAEPIVDEPVVDEPPVEVNPETIDMEVQIPTDQIAAAVAQATGDVVPAETAPDAVEAKQAEEEPMVAEETVPEGSAEAPTPQPVMESMEEGLDNKQYPLGVEIFDFIEGSCPNCTDEQMADKIASQFGIDKAKATKAVGLFHKGCVLMESEEDEDEDVLDNIDVPEEEDPADLPDSFAPADGDSDVDDLFSEEPDDDELLDKIEDFVNSDDHSTEDVSDALRTAAAFLDQIADDKKFSFADVVGEPAEEDEIDEGPMTDDKKDLQESRRSPRKRMREAKRFNKTITMETDKVFVGDPIEIFSEDFFDELCGGELPADGILRKDGKVVGLVTQDSNSVSDTTSEHTDYYYWLETGIIGIIDMKYAADGVDVDDCPRIVSVPSGKCKATVQNGGYDDVYLEVKDAKTGEKLFWDELDLGYDPDYYDEDEEDYDESKKSRSRRMRESKNRRSSRMREWFDNNGTIFKVEMETDKVFVGDPCYAMDKDVYHDIWGDVLDYADGPISKDDINYAVVAHTRWGDGTYTDDYTGATFDVDSGTLGITNLKYRREDEDDASLNRLGKVVDIPSGKCIAILECFVDGFNARVIDAESKKVLSHDSIAMEVYEEEEEEYDPYRDEDEDYYESRKNKQSKLRESNKPVNRKPVRLTSRPVVTERHSLKESSGIIYPAGSRPIGRSDEEDLVARQERVHEARRKAIREYRQKVVSQREQSRPANTGRFNEALRDSVRSIKESADPKSWAANTFMDKYEESSKLNYKELLKNGFLG